jgi:diguanylate cyclase (GGDEF)-like protein
MKPTVLLVIDDDPRVHSLMKLDLEGVCDQILYAVLPSQGLEMALEHLPDVILLDVSMPMMDGFEVCLRLKKDESTRDIPVVFLTADHSVACVAKGMDCGGTDYITKPFEPLELQARVRAALRTKQLIDLLKGTSRIDALTGLSNRAAFDAALASTISGHHRHTQPLALFLIDIDHFKRVNDTYGHATGDEVLRCVGATIRETCRESDVPCRYGGEEFAVILPQTNARNAPAIAERHLAAVRNLAVRSKSSVLRVTASGGLVCIPAHDLPISSEQLFDLADKALYQAKSQGRDRFVIHSSGQALPTGVCDDALLR